jgi:hypothetical protein
MPRKFKRRRQYLAAPAEDTWETLPSGASRKRRTRRVHPNSTAATKLGLTTWTTDEYRPPAAKPDGWRLKKRPQK